MPIILVGHEVHHNEDGYCLAECSSLFVNDSENFECSLFGHLKEHKQEQGGQLAIRHPKCIKCEIHTI